MRLPRKDKLVVEQIVACCHVGSTHEEVLRHMISKMKRGVWRQLDPDLRVALERHARRCHTKRRQGQACIQCRDDEDVATLREALIVNVLDGTVQLF